MLCLQCCGQGALAVSAWVGAGCWSQRYRSSAPVTAAALSGPCLPPALSVLALLPGARRPALPSASLPPAAA